MAMASSSMTGFPLLSCYFGPNFNIPKPTCSFPFSSPSFTHQKKRSVSVNVDTLDFSGFGSENDPISPVPELPAVEEPQCPPGLRPYETMAVLRPDMTEDERLSLTQKYEELLVAGGGMYVEVFNRGVIPLAYSIKKKNKAGETNTYLDGIYLLFTYFTKPESIDILEETLQADDNIVRSMTSKIRKRKY
ncbi:small ribosomal subunit protein bS6c [Gastrolobium bilobum]|uniref:small ribosomal subunit protein bS6c n=1 Tax=Gastrolobium bilobum TaxID=150636 RepID=UPI002AAF8E8F|nr:small ribosomal subunit protein bS6c [Gastrolobium bilobum]